MANYCVQSDIEKYLNITFANQPDPTVALWIGSASEKIDKYCGRDFSLHENEVEKYDGKGAWGSLDWQSHHALILKNHPVIAVDQVDVNGTTWTEDEEYVVYLDEAKILCTPSSRFFPKKAQTIEVTYDYGYASVPQSVVDACIWLVVCEFREMLKFSEAGVAQSVSIEGESVNFPEVQLHPDKILEALKPFIRWGY